MTFKKENLVPIDELVSQTLKAHHDLTQFPSVGPLSDRELIDRWLILALPRPSKQISKRELAQAMVYCGYVGRQLNHRAPSDFEKNLIEFWQDTKTSRSDAGVSLARRAINWWKSIESDRSYFRSRLDRVKRAPISARREFRDELAKFRAELLVVPKLRIVGGELMRDLHYWPTTLRAGYGHVLDLLLDSKNQYGKDLRNCAYGDCRMYFLSTPEGRTGPRSKYCSDPCRTEAKRQQQAAAQERYRNKP